MTRGILIAGNESSLSSALAAEAGRRVQSLAAAFIPSYLSEQGQDRPRNVSSEDEQKLIPLLWNPGSLVSARALVLAAENRLERIDDAVLVCAPPSARKRPDELNPDEIEGLAGDHIKGWLYIIRELSAYFRKRNSGTLSMVLSDVSDGAGRDDRADLIGPPAAAFFRALAQGVLTASAGEPYRTLAFSSSEAGEPGEFAAFVFKIIDDPNKRNDGRWHKYGKLGLFGR